MPRIIFLTFVFALSPLHAIDCQWIKLGDFNAWNIFGKDEPNVLRGAFGPYVTTTYKSEFRLQFEIKDGTDRLTIDTLYGAHDVEEYREGQFWRAYWGAYHCLVRFVKEELRRPGRITGDGGVCQRKPVEYQQDEGGDEPHTLCPTGTDGDCYLMGRMHTHQEAGEFRYTNTNPIYLEGDECVGWTIPKAEPAFNSGTSLGGNDYDANSSSENTDVSQ